MKKNFSFVQCATVLLLCTALVSAGILLYVNHLTNALEKETLLALQEFALQDAKHVEVQVKEDLDLLSSIATALSVFPESLEQNMLPLLKAEKAQNYFKNMEFVTTEGLAQLDDGTVSDLSKEHYFKQAMKGIPNISQRVVDFTDAAHILVEAVPVKRDGEVVGVLMGTRNTAEFGKMLEMQSFNGEGYSLLVDANGDKVVESFHKNAVSGLYNIFDMPDDPDHALRHQVLKDFSARRSGTVRYVSQKRGVLYVSYQSLGINNWYIISVVPEEFITQVTYSFITLLPLLCIFIALAAFVLGGYMCYAWPILRQKWADPSAE